MSLPDFWTRIKPFGQPGLSADSEPLNWKPYFLSLVIILTSTLSFGLGRLSAIGNREGIKLEYDTSAANTSASAPGVGQTASAIQSLPSSSTEVVGSSNGTKYHYPHCPGAKQISEKNRVNFDSAASAEASGYTLAANCKPR